MTPAGSYSRFLTTCIVACLCLSGALVQAEQENPDMTISVNMKQPGKPLPRTWKASQKLMTNTQDRLPSDYVLTKWEEEIGFDGNYRLKTELLLVSIGKVSLEDYADVCRRIAADGGTPFLTLLGIPHHLMSDPEALGMPPDTKPWLIRPNNPQAFKDLVKNYILFFSGDGLVIDNRHLGLQGADSQGIKGIQYHFWVEPTGHDKWQDTYLEFFKLYDRFNQAVREIRDEHPLLDFKVGGIHLNCWIYDQDCWRNIPYDPLESTCQPLYFLDRFLEYCTDPEISSEVRICDPPLDLEFFAFQTPRVNYHRNLTHRHHGDYPYIKHLLDYYGYDDTEIIRADILSEFSQVKAQFIPGYDFPPLGSGPEDSYIGCEVDNEIGASLIPAVLHDTTCSEDIHIDRVYFDFIKDIGYVYYANSENIPDGIADLGLYMGDQGIGFAGGSLRTVEEPVMKAGYNVLRMIGQLEDTMLDTGIETHFDNSEDLINTIVTRDSETGNISILVWYYIYPNQFKEDWDKPIGYRELLNRPEMVTRTVKIRLQNTNIRLARFRRFLMDEKHSNPWHYRKKIATEMYMNDTYSVSKINEWPGCALDMMEEKLISVQRGHEEELVLEPYSVVLIQLEPKEIYYSLF